MDYCTVQNVKDYLTIIGAESDALIASVITRVSSFIDGYCNCPLGFGHEVVTEKAPGLVDAAGNLKCWPSKPKVNSVSAMTVEYSVYASPMVATLAYIRISGYAVRVMDGTWKNLRGTDLLVNITYDGGFAVLPDELVHAATVISARAFKAKYSGQSDVVGSDAQGTLIYAKMMPREVKRILDGMSRVVVT